MHTNKLGSVRAFCVMLLSVVLLGEVISGLSIFGYVVSAFGLVGYAQSMHNRKAESAQRLIFVFACMRTCNERCKQEREKEMKILYVVNLLKSLRFLQSSLPFAFVSTGPVLG